MTCCVDFDSQKSYYPGPCQDCVTNKSENECIHSNWRACSKCVRNKLACKHFCTECKKLGKACNPPGESREDGSPVDIFDRDAVEKRKAELNAE
jgi:hypothetical protein